MSSKPVHAPIEYFPIADDQLLIGGKRVAELAEIAGKTPFYVYDRAVMRAKVELLRNSLPDQLRIHYAIKANPMPEVVRHMATLVDGLDLASGGELAVALTADMPVEHISFAGPGKSDAELADAVAAGVTINLESEGEMARLTHIGEQLGKRPQVAVRVNPDFELKASGMKMAGGPKPFGVDAERVPAMLAEIGARALDFRGFHIFSGSQNLRPEAIVEAQQQTFALARRLAEHVPSPIRTLNIGGGLGIPYFPGEQPLDLTPIAENLQQMLPDVIADLGCEVVMELGRYLVGEAGVYVCEVVDRKHSRGVDYLITNGGLHHHLAASGNFGQVIRKNYPVLNPEQVAGGERATVSVVGPLCTPLDILANQMELGAEGDYVAVLQSGAYGLSASPTRFLSHPEPAEIIVG